MGSFLCAVKEYQAALHFHRSCALPDAQTAHGGNDEE